MLGQTGADGRLDPLYPHAHPWFALDREAKVSQLFPHFRHIALQRRPAQVPGIGQLIELDPLFCRQQQDLQMQHPLATGARQGTLLSLRCQQCLKQRLIVDLQLVAAATLVDQVGTVSGNQFVEGRHIGAYGAGGDIEAACQLLLRQWFGMKLGQQLVKSRVGQLDHVGMSVSCCTIKGPMLTSMSPAGQAPVSD